LTAPLEPFVILSAVQGAIVKGGIHLEQLATVDTVCLDKTGTLTMGEPRVREVLLPDASITRFAEFFCFEFGNILSSY
jgi:P-type E1-E2 ATPase